MEILLIQANTLEEKKLVENFIKQNNLKGRLLTAEHQEDIVLGKRMEETDYNDIVSTDGFIKQLRD